jgi:hypothetical protein
MHRATLALLLVLACGAQAGQWEVSDADSFGWRRALVIADDERLAVVCPPDGPPFAVPVTRQLERGRERGEFTLGLDIDGERHDETMICSEVLCEVSLAPETWRALLAGSRVTLWVEDAQGPTFPLNGSAAALASCSGFY